MHSLVLVSHGILITREYFKSKSLSKFIKKLSNQMKIVVLFYSFSICAHGISNLAGASDPLTQVFLSLYNIFLFGALLLLIKHWFKLAITMSSSVKNHNNVNNIFFGTVIISTTLIDITIDLLTFLLPKYMTVLIIAQYCIWAFNCLLTGLCFGIIGSSVMRAMKPTLNKGASKFRKRVLKFQLIYWSYIILALPYASLYFIIISSILEGISLKFWLIVYAFINSAGIFTALILNII